MMSMKTRKDTSAMQITSLKKDIVTTKRFQASGIPLIQKINLIRVGIRRENYRPKQNIVLLYV